jgi:hypothetical protein
MDDTRPNGVGRLFIITPDRRRAWKAAPAVAGFALSPLGNGKRIGAIHRFEDHAELTGQLVSFLAIRDLLQGIVRFRLGLICGLRKLYDEGSVWLLRDHLTLLRDGILGDPILGGVCKC